MTLIKSTHTCVLLCVAESSWYQPVWQSWLITVYPLLHLLFKLCRDNGNKGCHEQAASRKHSWDHSQEWLWTLLIFLLFTRQPFFVAFKPSQFVLKNCESSIYGIVAAAMSSPSDLTHRLDGQGGSRREGVGEEGYPYLIAEYLLSVCPSNVNLPTPSLLMADVRSLLGGLNPVAVSEGIFDDQSIKCFGAATYDFFF